MALFGSSRDISMFRHINKELINNIIQTEVDIYRIILGDTKRNIYGEASSNKKYYIPIRVPSLINKENIINTTDELGTDTDQVVTFGFLRDGTLDELGFVPQIGDIIEWDEKYWEIDNVDINQYILGKNDATNKTVGSEFGANWSYLCKTHLTRRSKLHIEKVRFGS